MANAKKVGPTSQQLARQQAAGKDKNLLASTNKGKPNQEAIRSFNKTEGAGPRQRRTGSRPPGEQQERELETNRGIYPSVRVREQEGKPGKGWKTTAGNMAEHNGQGAGRGSWQRRKN